MDYKEKYNLLKTKEIIEILDGDRKFGELKGRQISMPYLSGPDLCSLSTRFGLPEEYTWKGQNKSRWVYLDNLMQYCIEHDKFEQLLAYLFSDSHFAKVLKGLTRHEIEELHSIIINTTIEKINGILFFGGHELVFLGNNILIKEISTDIEISIPVITKIDREYIVDISNRALIDIDNGNFDSAITKSRTLLEEVFCYVIELQKEIPTESGDINKLYQQAKSLYNMHQNSQLDKRINMLLSGLEKILKAISEMRNKDSDAHGVGNKRIKIEKHHAQLFVNASMTMSEFMLAVAEKTKITI